MPIAPGRACGWPGCHRLADRSGDSHCSVHRFLRDARRGTHNYGPSWTFIRERVLVEEPWCRLCAAADKRTPATQVDHILPKRDGGTDDRKNLRPLCHSCHSRRTAIDSSGWGRRRDLA
jgi:5-methylcytosine-specific restriction protein A